MLANDLRRGLIFCLMGALLLLTSQPVSGAPLDDQFFKGSYRYDVYFEGGYGRTSVLGDVEILGFKEIAGKMFLVVRPHGFNLKETDGYVLFEKVTAILPNENFKVQPLDQKNIR